VITVIRSQRTTGSSQGGATFTGDVWKDPILPRTGDGVGIANIHFAPGARTFWHTHEGGQILLIIAGEGLVGDADGPVRVAAGDVVWTPGGTPHWHGATSSRSMVHTAISLAGVAWQGEVGEEEYLAALVTPPTVPN
jgi:quercetin dioxygenase-like cupin family protein